MEVLKSTLNQYHLARLCLSLCFVVSSLEEMCLGHREWEATVTIYLATDALTANLLLFPSSLKVGDK